uniref:Tyrosine decarboxylase n=1 Tax=Rhabditophanes sp. KR3021 TaxID=114890 RepID=A0AC35TS26_9BILA
MILSLIFSFLLFITSQNVNIVEEAFYAVNGTTYSQEVLNGIFTHYKAKTAQMYEGDICSALIANIDVKNITIGTVILVINNHREEISICDAPIFDDYLILYANEKFNTTGTINVIKISKIGYLFDLKIMNSENVAKAIGTFKNLYKYTLDEFSGSMAIQEHPGEKDVLPVFVMNNEEKISYFLAICLSILIVAILLICYIRRKNKKAYINLQTEFKKYKETQTKNSMNTTAISTTFSDNDFQLIESAKYITEIMSKARANPENVSLHPVGNILPDTFDYTTNGEAPSAKKIFDEFFDIICPCKKVTNFMVTFFIAASFGTSYACSYDNFSELEKIAKPHDIWVHVDASYGGNALFAIRQKSSGIEAVTSLMIQPSKFMTTSSSAVVLYSKKNEFTDLFGRNLSIISLWAF